MKFSEKWLRQWVNPDVSTNKLAEQLTMAGLEVEAIEAVAAELNNVVVGQVKSLEAHPNADKLRVCSVDVGKGELLSIVCGASNVEENGKYPVALLGAELPNNIKIKKAKLRGVESTGMMCSAKELGMAEQADGLLTLPDEAPVGTNIDEYFQLDDKSIELSLTPNRGDCLSIAGVAREVGVLNNTNLTVPEIKPVAPGIDDTFPVKITAAAENPHYVGRVIRDVNPKAPTPLWMQEKLRRSGIRSISAVVDITNYVLLELGQPMHAFDLDKLQGGINVRLANEGEKITLLDGQEISLTKGSLVIADDKQAQALAGIMGGNDSAVTDDTQHIFLESAYFSPTHIAGKARGYSLHTDSSHRFERGVDPDLQIKAVERATALLLEIVGGKPGPVIDCQESQYIPNREKVALRKLRLQKVLGVDIPQKTVTEILNRLDMQVKEIKDGWQVTAPSFRFDIEREEDLIEEVARIYGYNNIPSSHSKSAGAMGEQSEAAVSLKELQNVLVQRDYQEAVTYSFVDPKVQSIMNPDVQTVELANPISADMGQMRTNLWSGLLSAVGHNLNRQQLRVRLFETGLRFEQGSKTLIQEPMIAGAISGGAYDKQWSNNDRNVDFYDIKSDVESILTLTGQADSFMFVADKHPALHPGQTAKIVRQQVQLNQKHADIKSEEFEHIGWVGAVHPNVIKTLDLPQTVYVFELKLSAITQRAIPQFKEIPKFPSIKRDIAIIVDENVNAQAVSDCIKGASTTILSNLKLFDVYQGEGVDSGRKSLAYSLTLQDHERTLTDQDVDKAIDEILNKLHMDLGGTLRN